MDRDSWPRQGMDHGQERSAVPGSGPKTKSNRAQNTARALSDFVDFLVFLCICFFWGFNYSKMAN